METQEVYLTARQADNIKKKLEKHIDDLLSDIRQQVVIYLEDIIISYLPDHSDVKLVKRKKSPAKKTVKK